jgi:O-antigen/teichoic acid export membrane protein
MFDYAWKPFFLSHAKDENAKPLFARVLTYFLFVMCGIFLVLSLFISDFVHIRILGRYIIHPDYWSGLSIVPIVLLGYIFGGVFIHLNAGIFIEKKTAYLLPTSMLGAVANIVANFFLIPRFGIVGAAYATLISYSLTAFTLYFVVQKFYHIEYEIGRLVKLAISIGLVYLLYIFADARGVATILAKLVFCLAWPAILLLIGFFDSNELSRIVGLLGRRTRKSE